MATIHKIEMRIASVVNEGFERGFLHSYLREMCYQTIKEMLPKRVAQYEVHGLRKFALGMLDLELFRSNRRSMFYLCKDNKWRCKGYYTYQNQPELPTCTTDIMVFTYPPDLIRINILSITSETIQALRLIQAATGVPVADVEYNKVGETEMIRRISFVADFSNPIIDQPVSKKDLVAGIKLK